MITEDYVSFETSKLLKEKGFNGECIAYYSIYKDNNESLHRWRNRQTYVNVKNDGYTIVPTLQMAMKWLRETYDTFISVEPGAIFGRFDVYVYYDNYTKLKIIERNKDNYEEACEEAIKYCLENLI